MYFYYYYYKTDLYITPHISDVENKQHANGAYKPWLLH